LFLLPIGFAVGEVLFFFWGSCSSIHRISSRSKQAVLCFCIPVNDFYLMLYYIILRFSALTSSSQNRQALVLFLGGTPWRHREAIHNRSVWQVVLVDVSLVGSWDGDNKGIGSKPEQSSDSSNNLVNTRASIFSSQVVQLPTQTHPVVAAAHTQGQGASARHFSLPAVASA
jgi:hypothetical protein